jgi:hypothetical protein
MRPDPLLRSVGLPAFAVLAAFLPGCEMSVYSGAGVSAGVGAAAAAPASAPTPSPLPGWSIEGHAHQLYAAETDTEVTRDGRPTVRFHPTDDAGGAYATYMTSLDAVPFRGRRAHAFVWVRTQGVTGRGDVWLRAQAADSPADGPGLATSIGRLATNADFTRYELFIDVPVDATKVQLGLGLGGPGMLWMDGVKVEAQ